MAREQALLTELGRRLRSSREGGGWSVSEVARRAGVSRRTLTEAEAGRANLTVLMLARLARVLRAPLGELCDLPLGAVQGERLALVGLRGAGKSTVGRQVALALEVPLVELDARVEALAGMTLSELFDLRGASTYRRLEREALEEVLSEGQRVVLVAGGSIVQDAANFARLREAARTVWLRASPEEHLTRVLDQGDGRPSAGRPRAMEELRDILARRGPLYALCDLEVDTSGRAPDEVVAEVLAWWGS
jgi:XRE family transcriptional regulator, aerobic/anaerobic benzoate catabolism transcriptional regulator